MYEGEGKWEKVEDLRREKAVMYIRSAINRYF